MAEEAAPALAKALADPLATPPKAPPDSDGDAGKGGEPLELVPHEGMVFADDVGDKTILTHMMTCEHMELPGIGWTLAFDSDGFAAAVPPDNSYGEPVILEDALRFQLYRKKNGNYAVVSKLGQNIQCLDLCSFMQRWVNKDITLRLGATAAEKTFNGALFRWPRMPGACYIISMKSLYVELGFKQFSGQQWRWADSGWRRWKKSLEQEFHIGDHLVPSGQSKEGAGDASTGMLPWVGVSSHGLLALLAKWSEAVLRFGGLTEPKARLASSEMLVSLLDLIVPAQGGVFFDISISHGWRIVWPRPADRSRCIPLHITSEGQVDLVEFVDRVKAKFPASKKGWWWSAANLEKLLTDVHSFGVYDVFRFLSRDRVWHDFFKQLVWGFGQHLEMLFRGKKGVDGLKMLEPGFEELLDSAPLMDRKLVQYVQAGRRVAESLRLRSYSLCTDKVVRAAEIPLELAKAEGSASAVKEEKSNVVARQVGWLKRKEVSGDKVTWKPTKRYRTGARQWLYALDNQIQQNLPEQGLGAFVRKDEALDAPWRGWKHLLITCDQGADGLAALSYLRAHNYNFTAVLDWSHAAQNDFYDSLRSLGMWPFWVLMLVTWNVEHGPWSDDYRWAQVQESWQTAVEHFGPEDLPLFKGHLTDMIAEFGGAAKVMMDAEGDDISKVIWQKMATGWRPKGYKTNLNRFFASRGKAASFLPWWSATLTKYEFLCLETGQIANKKVGRLKMRADQKADDGQQGTTDSARPTVAEKALRSSAQNAMFLSTIMLGDKWHQLLVRALVQSSSSLHQWHSTQNRTIRSTADGTSWAVKQLAGGFQEVISQTLSEFQTKSSLEFVGFDLRVGAGGFDEGQNIDEVSAMSGSMEQDLAQVFCGLCCTLAARRIVRTFFFTRGWPLRLMALLGDEELRKHTLLDFRADWEAFSAMRDYPEKDAALEELVRRSPFNDVATRQFVQACTEFDWTDHPSIQKLASENYTGILASQLCEDCFNFQKNSRLVKGKRKYRRVEKTYGIVLAKEVVSKQHRYGEVPCDVPTQGRSIRLPKEAFAFQPKLASENFGKVAGPNAVPAWYSPSAANWTTRDADLQLIKYCHQKQCWGKAKDAWLGDLCKAEHSLLLKHPDITGNRWVFAMYHWRSSCVLAFVAKELTLPGTELRCWCPDASQAPLIMCVVELRGWRAIHYKWRSPAWQCWRSPGAAELPLAVRAFVSEENEAEDTLLNVAAKRCFFGLEKSWLVNLAKHRNIALTSTMTLCDILHVIISTTLGSDEEMTLRYLSRRIAGFTQRGQFSEEFAQLDEAAELLEQQDQQKVKDEKKAQQALAEQEESFKQDYTRKRREQREATAKGNKNKRKASVKTVKIPKFPENNIPISLARSVKPPDAALWMSASEGNWQGHFRPEFPRVSRSWNRWGEAGALTAVLQVLWDHHCQYYGLTRAECGVEGLWPEEAAPAAASSSGAGST